VNGDDPYLISGSSVLRNKLGIIDAGSLDQIERRFVAQRIAEVIPAGRFDLAHLRAIHRHLFQDVYPWAGELRTVEIAKDGHQFQFRRVFETGWPPYQGAWASLFESALRLVQRTDDENAITSTLAVIAIHKGQTNLGRLALLTEDGRAEMLATVGWG
jgi:hypothetical protein